MTPLYTKEDFEKAKYNDKLLLKCKQCLNNFYKEKTEIKRALKPNSQKKYNFCSPKCYFISMSENNMTNCFNCGVLIKKSKSEIMKTKNSFCSRSCNGFYQSQHKLNGSSRSKLERYIENELSKLYPNLHIDYNKTYAINAELDIFIPSINLAFELNGIFHYEPIFGSEKLNKTKSKDFSKSKLCIDNRIDLCIIDTSGQKYFKEDTSKKYLDIITNIINQRTI